MQKKLTKEEFCELARLKRIKEKTKAFQRKQDTFALNDIRTARVQKVRGA